MHYLCSTFGSSGDVFPIVGLGAELARRGHRVTVLTNPHFESIIREQGLGFEPLGTEADYKACILNPDLWVPHKAFKHIFETLKTVLREQYEIHARWAGQPDVVAVSNCLGMGSRVAQEKFQMPLITVHLQPGVIWSKYDPPTFQGVFGPNWLKTWMFALGEKLMLDGAVLPFLNPWRKELGLPPVRRITRWWNSPDGVLCLFPDWYAAPQLDWPAPLLQADFPLWNHKSDAPLSQEVGAFLDAGTPPIVVTPGTANCHASKYFSSAVTACERLGRRGLFLTPYREQLPAQLPKTILHADYVPLDLVLPRAGAFIHHGGVGSVSQGFLGGVPQVILPLAHDQFDNAARVKKLGVGDSLTQAKLNGEQLTKKLQPLLDNAAVKSRCAELRQRLLNRNGLTLAADLIERQVATQRRNAGARG